MNLPIYVAYLKEVILLSTWSPSEVIPREMQLLDVKLDEAVETDFDLKQNDFYCVSSFLTKTHECLKLINQIDATRESKKIPNSRLL